MKSISLIGDVTLGIFLSMALLSIKLWEVAQLALPMLVIVFAQVVFIVLLSVFVLFKLLGKNYDAAVMVGGFTGHGLGATPNAMANMYAITDQFGPSRKAFLIVPIVGAFLIDVFGMPIIITTIKFKKIIKVILIGFKKIAFRSCTILVWTRMLLFLCLLATFETYCRCFKL